MCGNLQMVPTCLTVILKNRKIGEGHAWRKEIMPGSEGFILYREKSFRQLRVIDLVCEGTSTHACMSAELNYWDGNIKQAC